jgi:serine/threonine-protein kinase RsbW
MNAKDWKWTLDRQVSSNPDVCPKVIGPLLEALEQFQWNEDDRFAIRMAVEEALMNAIKHGNESNPDKPVHIVLKISDTEFYAKITDQGIGFDPETVCDPTLDENVNKACGRGVMLIKNFVDTVSYNATGNEVEMTKQRSSNAQTNQ